MSEPGEDATDSDAAGRPPGDMLSVGMLNSASSIPLPTTYNVEPDSSVRVGTHNFLSYLITLEEPNYFYSGVNPGP